MYYFHHNLYRQKWPVPFEGNYMCQTRICKVPFKILKVDFVVP